MYTTGKNMAIISQLSSHTGGMITNTRIVFRIAKALLAAYIVTGLGLLILAFALYKFGLSTNATELGVVFIYILSTAVGGLFLGKCVERRRFLWGMLLGLVYVLVLILVSCIARGNMSGIAESGISVLILCLAGGTLGGILS